MQLPAQTDESSVFPPREVPAFRLIDDELGRVKKLIDEQLAASSEPVSRLLRRTNTSSGKMIRPMLVLLAGVCCGKLTDKHVRVAAIVEMMHNATLLHDDVIDEGQKRRGLPTVNSLWGNESAVLLGDFLLSKVFKMCAELEPQITRVIAAATVRICEGELRQIMVRHPLPVAPNESRDMRYDLSESEYIEIITEKSAALFSIACLLGGFLAGAGETQIQAMSDFGLNLGIAFQITDDLLDIIGDESKTGKTLGSDVNKNKLTLATIHLLRAVDESGKSGVTEMLNSPGESKKALVEMLRSYGSLGYAHGRAQDFVAKAIASLAGLKESDAKDALLETAKFVGRRAI